MPDYVAWVRNTRRSSVKGGSLNDTYTEDSVYPFTAANEDDAMETLSILTDRTGSRGGPLEIKIMKCWEVKKEVNTTP